MLESQLESVPSHLKNLENKGTKQNELYSYKSEDDIVQLPYKLGCITDLLSLQNCRPEHQVAWTNVQVAEIKTYPGFTLFKGVLLDYRSRAVAKGLLMALSRGKLLWSVLQC